jgi:hypothetical protein
MTGHEEPTAATSATDDDHVEALALLASIVRGEPRLTLSSQEAHEAANLIADWHRRGASNAQITSALTHALPAELRFPGRLVLARLRDRMPPIPAAPPVTRFTCVDCGDPLSRPGICRPCLFGEHSLRLEQDRAKRNGPGKGQIAYFAARTTIKRSPRPSLLVPSMALSPLPDITAPRPDQPSAGQTQYCTGNSSH